MSLLRLENIGKIFGGRDHATVKSSINNVEKRLPMNNQLHIEVSELIKEIKE